MAENKTKPIEASVADHLATIQGEGRRRDCEALVRLMSRATGLAPVMRGSGIVGLGSYNGRYDSGHESDACLVGFASRKGDISVYGLNAAPEFETLLPTLGRCKTGKGCL